MTLSSEKKRNHDNCLTSQGFRQELPSPSVLPEPRPRYPPPRSRSPRERFAGDRTNAPVGTSVPASSMETHVALFVRVARGSCMYVREHCQHLSAIMIFMFFFVFFFFHLTYSRWTSHYHPACGHKGSSHLSPVHALQFFYRDASSALLQLVNQWLNFTYSRSHAFRYERKNTNPTVA